MVNIGSLETEVTVDVDRVLNPPRIRCTWFRKIDTKTGEIRLVIWAVDRANDRRIGTIKRRARTVTVEGHRLACDCEAFYYSKPGHKSCKHVVGAATWLEVEAAKAVDDRDKIAFCLSCHNDPHRLAARTQRRQEAVGELEKRTGRRASLEDLFDI